VHNLFIDSLAQRLLRIFSRFLIGISHTPASQPVWLTDRDVPAKRQTISLVYLISGAGDPSENARSNDARSSGGMSETAM
jgi:hypothetical protein